MEEAYEDKDDSSDISKLFMELASETRFSLLQSLSRKPAKLSSLSRELNTSVQDIYRNLGRLVEEGLVSREDGEFDLTEYGMVVMKQAPDFIIMRRYRRFFQEHTLSGVIPDKFLQRIGALNNSKIVNSATAVFQSLKKIQSSANESLKIIVSQAWPEEGEILIDRASNGIRISALVGKNTIFPRNVIEHIMPRVNEFVSKGIMERRMVDRVGVAIYIADHRNAAIAFPNAKGEVDMTTLFENNADEDSSFCEWCTDYFDFMWEQSTPFDLNKVRIVEY